MKICESSWVPSSLLYLRMYIAKSFELCLYTFIYVKLTSLLLQVDCQTFLVLSDAVLTKINHMSSHPLQTKHASYPLCLMIGIIGSTIVLIICRRPGAPRNVKLRQLGFAIFISNKNNTAKNTIRLLCSAWSIPLNLSVSLQRSGSDGSAPVGNRIEMCKSTNI